MRTIHNDKDHGLVLEFDTLSDYIKTAHETPPKGLENRIGKEKRSDFEGKVTWSEAMDMVKTGWPEGLADIKSAIASASTLPAQGPSMFMDVAGAYPVAAMAAAGEPASMVNPQPVEDRVRPVVRLAVNTWASCAYSHKQYMVYGASLVSYMDALESAGYRVELIAAVHCVASSNSKRYTTLTTVKKAEDPLELDKMAYVFAHASMLRFFGFQNMMVSDMGKALGNTCGSPAQIEQRHVSDPDNTIILSGINSVGPGNPALNNVDDCLALIGPQIEAQMKDHGMPLPDLAFVDDDLGSRPGLD